MSALRYFGSRMEWTPAKARQYVDFYTRLGAKVPLAKQEKEMLSEARQFLRRLRRRLNPLPRLRRPNPARRAVVIYGRLSKIEATKTQKHRCDAKCRAAGHRYYHPFTPGAVIYGLPNGDLYIRNSKGKRLWKYF